MWVATAASSANSTSLMRTSRTFVMALRRARLKSLPSERVRRYIPSVVVSNAFFSNRLEKIPECWSMDAAALFYIAADFEWLRGAAIELHRPTHCVTL